MLSVEECRAILGQPQLTDAEVEEIRDTLVAFAHTFIDGFLQERAKEHSPRRHGRAGKA